MQTSALPLLSVVLPLVAPAALAAVAAHTRASLAASGFDFTSARAGAMVGTPAMASLVEAQCGEYQVCFAALVHRLERAVYLCRFAESSLRCPAADNPSLLETVLEVADSSFGAWLDAGGERRQTPRAERDPWTPEQRAKQLAAAGPFRTQTSWPRAR